MSDSVLTIVFLKNNFSAKLKKYLYFPEWEETSITGSDIFSTSTIWTAKSMTYLYKIEEKFNIYDGW